jgi:hypothetical protein
MGERKKSKLIIKPILFDPRTIQASFVHTSIEELVEVNHRTSHTPA